MIAEKCVFQITMIKTISFDEIVKGHDSTVRVTDDGLLYAVDLVMAITGKDGNDSGLVLRRLSEDVLQVINLMHRKTPGKGNARTKLISYEHAISLIMVIPGAIATELRLAFVDIIKRYIQGDESMHAELQINKDKGIQSTCLSILNKAISKKKKSHAIPKTKYIYVFASEAFEEEVKIGRATDVKARLSSGNTMCAPKPHRIIAVAPTLDSERDEAMAHTYFAQYRTRGEFFKVSHTDASSFLANYIAPRYFQELNELMQGMEGSSL